MQKSFNRLEQFREIPTQGKTEQTVYSILQFIMNPSWVTLTNACPMVSQDHPAPWLQPWTTTNSQMTMSTKQPRLRRRPTRGHLPLVEEGRWTWGTGGDESQPQLLVCLIWTRLTLEAPAASRWGQHVGCPRGPSGLCWPAAYQKTAPWRGWTQSERSTRPKEVAETS